jgi:hypothetical protein
MKLLIHLVVFSVGCGMGIWWGVNHPVEAANIHDLEEQKAAQIRVEVLKQLDDSPKAKQMLANEQSKLSGK